MPSTHGSPVQQRSSASQRAAHAGFTQQLHRFSPSATHAHTPVRAVGAKVTTVPPPMGMKRAHIVHRLPQVSSAHTLRLIFL